ncbi:MAG TPA: DUF1648 domain-containing protein [Brumimicrobium sp.]|nr:DUF1648 domain-containing protein [Brumimicrobium sp.]
MNERPRIKIVPSSIDKLIDLLAWILLALIWVYIFMNYATLPDVIPTHFDAGGTADDFGAKETIFLISFVITALFTGLSILIRYPHTFNYPITLTEENTSKNYALATRLIRLMKLMLTIIFALIIWKTIAISKGELEELGTWFLPGILGLIFLPTVWYLITVRRINT